MLRRARRHASTVAATLLVSVITLGGSLAAPHHDVCHDTACVPVAVEHDAAAHQMRANAGTPAAHPLHCLVCHWARSFRPRTEARIVSAPEVEARTRVGTEPVAVFASASVAQPPLRSPPASPVFA